jgi:hypothetical protein
MGGMHFLGGRLLHGRLIGAPRLLWTRRLAVTICDSWAAGTLLFVSEYKKLISYFPSRLV